MIKKKLIENILYCRIGVDTAQPIQPAAAQPMQPAAAQPMQPAAAQHMQPAAAQPMQPAAAQPMQPAAAQPIQPAAAQPMQPAAIAQHKRPRNNQTKAVCNKSKYLLLPTCPDSCSKTFSEHVDDNQRKSIIANY